MESRSRQSSRGRHRYIEARAANALKMQWPQGLPVVERLGELRAAIEAHQVVIVAGETGSGKSTQLPKLCMAIGRGIDGMIAHTQPRRLAARTLATRIAEECGTSVGAAVGYQVRFAQFLGDGTRLKLLTDGMLLTEFSADRRLRRYDTIIIDEAHERSLNIDFLLGLLKMLLPQRPDLKLIITSATIDTDRFAAFFDDAPVVTVAGRGYPVEIQYAEHLLSPHSDGHAAAIEAALQELAVQGLRQRGGVLVFLSGEAEIREVAAQLRHSNLTLDVLPLYARLGQRDQQRIFSEQGSGWRVVLATNVAETSLTVPGIAAVIDTGIARVARYSHRSRLQRLPVEPVSRASADQRAGRCGRTGPGVAIRLYSEQDYLSRPEFTEPEIQRSNLAAVILQMLQLRLGEIEGFPFLDAPDSRLLREGFKTLSELGAVVEGKLTALGRDIARFPVDPGLARMLLAARGRACLREMLIVAAALSVMDPRERPVEKRAAADQAHARFRHEQSDFMSWLLLWDYVEARRAELSSSAFRRLCRREFLSWQKLREWRDVHRQLLLQTRAAGFTLNTEPADYRGLHTALLTGLLGNIGKHEERGEYIGAHNRRFRLFPGTGLKRKTPPWIVAAEIVETRQVYARCVAAVEPQWIAAAGEALLRYRHVEPHWQARSGRVMAREKRSLYGLELGDGKLVHFGTIDPVVSRDIFIRSALVEGRLRTRARFFAHNADLLAAAREREQRLRRRDLVISDDALYAWYNQRIPADIVTARQLASWLKKRGDDALRLSESEVYARDASDAMGGFPSQLVIDDLSLPLTYRFEPGHESDGVNLTVPVAALNRVPSHLPDWLVPGLLAEKVEALLRTLPRHYRKQLAPIPDLLPDLLVQLNAGEGALLPALRDAIAALRSVDIPDDCWRPEQLPEFYGMNIRVVDERGKLLAQARDFAALRHRFASQTRRELQQQTERRFPAGMLTEWCLEALPAVHEVVTGDVPLKAYPAMVDRGEGVEITMLDTPAAGADAHIRGVARLYLLRQQGLVSRINKDLWRDNATQLQFAAVGQQREQWVADLMLAAARDCFMPDGVAPRSAEDFRQRWQRHRGRFREVVAELDVLLASVLEAAAALVGAQRQLSDKEFEATVEDINAQLAELLMPGFIWWVEREVLAQYPRYLASMQQRAVRVRGHGPRETRHREALRALREPLFQKAGGDIKNILKNSQLRDFYYRLHEYNVSLYAQGLGTRFPVSEKRLRNRWQEISQSG